MQTKLKNWVTSNLVTGEYSLSYDVLNITDLDCLIELAQEAKKELQDNEEFDSILSSKWAGVDFELDGI